MAELLTSEGWVKASSAAAYLREALPDDYFVVADPRVAGQRVAAAVVGRGALFVVEGLDAESEEDAGSDAPAPALSAGQAARRFLQDEFPLLTMPILPMASARDWADGAATWRVMQPPEWADQPLADAIIAEDAAVDVRPTEDARAALALGLRDRQITASQSTRRPFVFRSGRGFRTGERVSTVRDAVQHMDRYPADGAQVLRDGTLAAWFEDEGAHHLAALARDAAKQPNADARVVVETFLIDTGLVARPTLRARPATVDLGYVAQGRTASQRLRLEKPRGSRGLLFGAVAGGAPWVRVEPRSFAGAPAELVVTADTTGLQISGEPYLSDVAIIGSAGAEPVRIPVTLRVVAEPPRFARRIARPFLGFALGGLLGALIGALWGVTGLIPADGRAMGMGALALVWAWAGAVRGWGQPPAWPARVALGRWLVKALAWSAGLGLLAALIVQAWRLGLGGGLEFEGLTLLAAAVGGAAFGFLPATLDELAHSRHARNQDYVHGRRSSRRPVILAAGAAALLLIALLAPRVLVAAVNRTEVQATIRPATSWIETRLETWGAALDRFINDLTLRYYDKPAGSVGGAPIPEGGGIRLPKFLGGQ